MNSTFRTRTFLFFAFSYLLNVLTAQEKPVVQITENNVDSLEQAVLTSKDHLEKVEIYGKLGSYYNGTGQFNEAKRVYTLLISLAIEHDLPDDLAAAYSSLSAYYHTYGKYDSLKLTNRKAIKIAEENGLNNSAGLAYGNLGNAYMRLGDRDTAMMYYQRALELVEDEELKMKYTNNVASVHFAREEYYQALSLFQQVLDLARKSGDEILRGKFHANIGNVQRILKEHKAALESYQKAKEIMDKHQNKMNLALLTELIGLTYQSMDSLQLAIEHYNQSLEIAEPFKDTAYIMNGFMNLVLAYDKKEDIENMEGYAKKGLAIHYSDSNFTNSRHAGFNTVLARVQNVKGNFKEAKKYLIRALRLNSDEVVTYDNILLNIKKLSQNETYYKDALLNLYTAEKGLGRYKNALLAYEELQAIQDSLEEVKNITETKNIEAKFRVTEKENELKILEATKNAELKAKQAETNFYTTLAIGAAVLATGLFFFMQRLRKQKKQLTTQNRVIRAQEKELRSLDELKSRFFANVSHEFRTPISLILGPISTILNRNKLENRDFTLLQLAKQNCSNLLKLIGEILDLTKLESGNLQLVEEKITLYSSIRRTASSFQSLADSKGIGFRFDYQADQQLQVKMDTEKFKTILNNLLSNAFKFTPKDGQVKLAIHDQGQQLLFQVADTGKGIREEDLPHIFNRFYQAADEKETAQGGTGIGLALCNEYVKLFHGRLWVESTWGKGSTFYFEIPKKEMLGTLPDEDVLILKTEAQAASPVMTDHVKEHFSATTSGQANKQTILIVEDNKDLQDYLRIILEEQYHILVSNNGQEALELLDNCFNNDVSPEQRPSLVLSDVMMPLMDGFQLLEKIKQDDRTRLLPVIMLTARAELRDRLHALRIGVDDYMLKPFEEEELLVRAENLLRNTNERLATLSKQGKSKNTPAHSASDIAWLTEQESLLRSRLTDPSFTPSRWAEEIALSERQLQRKLKSLTGLSPRLYLVEMRLNEARTLLEDRQFSTVAEVAYAVGFNHAVSFTRNFKKRFGKLPSEYLGEQY